MYKTLTFATIIQSPFWLIGFVLGFFSMPLYRGFLTGLFCLQEYYKYKAEKIAMDTIDNIAKKEQAEDEN